MLSRSVFHLFHWLLPLSIHDTSLLPLIIGGVLVGFFSSKRLQRQDKLKELAIVFLLPLAYTAVLWAIFMLITGGFSGAFAWLVYCIFHVAMAPIFFIALLMGEGRLFLWAPLAYEISFAIGILLAVLIKRDWKVFSFNKKQWLSSFDGVCPCDGYGCNHSMATE